MQEPNKNVNLCEAAQSTDGRTDASVPTLAQDERITEVAARILKKYRVAFEELAK